MQAETTADVIAAVELAKRDSHRIAVCSGGHSWSGNHLRDGGMLLDLSAMNSAAINKEKMLAIVGPGCKGDELLERLGKEKLFFPVGHCRGVGLGGYLLQGGYGWHGRTLGPACMSVEGLDIVTADGDLVHASAKENSDLFWAARGAGPGFFGIVISFYLKLYERPPVIGFTLQNYPISCLEELFNWAYDVGPSVARSVELMLIMSRNVLGVHGPGIIVIAPVFANSPSEANDATRFMRDNPLRPKATLQLPFVPSGMRLLYRGVQRHYPDGCRYAVDNMWTHASIDALMPGLKSIAETLPPAPSHVLWMNWMPPASRPDDMAYSMEDRVYLSLYGAWKDKADDEKYAPWAVSHMQSMQHLASGIQLADENLGQRPARFASDENMQKLDEVRATRDPENRFHPWMGRLK